MKEILVIVLNRKQRQIQTAVVKSGLKKLGSLYYYQHDSNNGHVESGCASVESLSSTVKATAFQ